MISAFRLASLFSVLLAVNAQGDLSGQAPAPAVGTYQWQKPSIWTETIPVDERCVLLPSQPGTSRHTPPAANMHDFQIAVAGGEVQVNAQKIVWKGHSITVQPLEWTLPKFPLGQEPLNVIPVMTISKSFPNSEGADIVFNSGQIDSIWCTTSDFIWYRRWRGTDKSFTADLQGVGTWMPPAEVMWFRWPIHPALERSLGM